jgi:Ca2+-binding RTX toxin-like protein
VAGGGSFITDASDGTTDGVIHLNGTTFGNITVDTNLNTVVFASIAAPSADLLLDYQIGDGHGGTAIGQVTVTPVTNASDNTAQTLNLGAVTDLFTVSYIDAGGGADTVLGGAGQDTLFGAAQGDSILGGSNDDFLNGGAQADVIKGGDGNDIIRGDANNDTLDGGNGVDLLDFSGVSGGFAFTLGASGNGSASVDGNDTYSNFEGVIGGSGSDTLTGNSGDNIIRGGPGNDIIDGGAGKDLLDFSDGTGGITMTLVQSSSNTTVNLSAAGLGIDTYKNMEGVIGTRFADLLPGSSGNDLLRGGAGNDTLSGGGGKHTQSGGERNEAHVGNRGI